MDDKFYKKKIEYNQGIERHRSKFRAILKFRNHKRSNQKYNFIKLNATRNERKNGSRKHGKKKFNK